MSDQAHATPTDETIVLDQDLAEPPHRVWRALSEPDLLAAWLGPNDIRPEIGHRFHIETAGEPGSTTVIECEVLTVEPERSISYSWREDRGAGPGLESRVTWTLTPTVVGGTRLRLVHDGFAMTNGRTLAMAGQGIGRALAPRILSLLAA